MSLLPDPRVIEQTLSELATHIKQMHLELHSVVSDLHEDIEQQNKILREQNKILSQVLEELRHRNIN